jgi:DNA-binding LacI/PurR family transcriptional regulator
MVTNGSGGERKKVPTIRQVAEAAGVSIATVSRVLSGKGGVSDGLAEKVRQSATDLNFRPNRVARGLRRQHTQTIGVLVTDIQNPFFTSVLQSIECVLETSGYVLLLCNSDEQPGREKIHLATLQAEGVAGVIIAPTRSEPGRYQPVVDNGTPMVLIDREVQDLRADCVTINNHDACVSAVNHLVSLGHTKIGLIAGPSYATTSATRKKGYLQALRDAGIGHTSDFIQAADYKQNGGYDAMGRLLKLADRPTAVIVLNNLMTLGALQAIHEQKLSVPGDIALLGFDDMPWAACLQPPLTVIAQPTYALGEAAAKLLVDRVQNPNLPIRKLMLEAALVVRASTASVAAASPDGARK